MYAKKEKLYPAYVSKYNSNHEKLVILLINSNGGKQCEAKSEVRWHLSCSKKTIDIIKRHNF